MGIQCYCDLQVLRNTGVELGSDDTERIHLSAPLDNFKHHQSLARTQREFESELIVLKSTAATNMDNISKSQTSITQLEQLSKEAKEALSNKIMELQTQMDNLRKRANREAEAQSVDNNLATRVKHLEVQDANNQLIIKNQRKEIADLKAELQAFRREYHQQMHRGSHAHGVPRHTSVSGRDNQGIDKIIILYYVVAKVNVNILDSRNLNNIWSQIYLCLCTILGTKAKVMA